MACHMYVSPSGYIFQNEIPDIFFDGYRKIALPLALLIFILPEVWMQIPVSPVLTEAHLIF